MAQHVVALHPRISIKPDQTLCQLKNNVENQIIISTVALAQLKNSVPAEQWQHTSCVQNVWLSCLVWLCSGGGGAHVSRQKQRRTPNKSTDRDTHTCWYARVHILNGIHNELLLTPMCYNYCSNKGAQKHLKRIGSKNGDEKSKEIMLFQCVWVCTIDWAERMRQELRKRAHMSVPKRNQCWCHCFYNHEIGVRKRHR